MVRIGGWSVVSVATLHSGTPEPFERRFVTRFMGAETIGVGFYASWVSCRRARVRRHPQVTENTKRRV